MRGTALLNMREVETRLVELVVAELGALRWDRRDAGGVQLRDFDLVFADGR